jgi:hypothetical protein
MVMYIMTIYFDQCIKYITKLTEYNQINVNYKICNKMKLYNNGCFSGEVYISYSFMIYYIGWYRYEMRWRNSALKSKSKLIE